MTLLQIIYVTGLSVFPLHRCYKEFVAGGSGIFWAILILSPQLVVMVVLLASADIAWTPWVYLLSLTVSLSRFFLSNRTAVPSMTVERNLMFVGMVVLLLSGLLLFLATRRYVFIEDPSLGRIVTFDRLTGTRR